MDLIHLTLQVIKYILSVVKHSWKYMSTFASQKVLGLNPGSGPSCVAETPVERLTKHTPVNG